MAVTEPPSKDSPPEEWHECTTLPNGTEVRKLGACWYVVDDGEILSRGYHDILVGMNGDLVGKYGAEYHKIKNS